MGGKTKLPISITKPISKSPLHTGNISPIPHSKQKPLDTFAYTPEKPKEPALELAEILTARPKNSNSKKSSKAKTFTSLYYRAKEIAQNKEKKVKAIFEEGHPFKPKLNLLSEKIVKEAKKEGKDIRRAKKSSLTIPEPITEEQPKTPLSLSKFLERNYIQPLIKAEERKVSHYIPSLDRLDEFCTFSPSLDRKSLKIAKKNQVDIYTKALRSQEEKRLLSYHAKKNQEIQEMTQCTFTPQINRNIDISPKVTTRTKSETRTPTRQRGSYSNSPYRLSLGDSHELN
ncbi:hypothetical protein SteCoe_18891 [Stentor coeruleus]|uniref:Uncharacterized protein n=1 Tax=Stentor coeruleus TaxID=5963 RepID=A0A1R2BVE7_9CILI|nr:hypothetical protein SteCoe_18891 [Stentor coeruleus]